MMHELTHKFLSTANFTFLARVNMGCALYKINASYNINIYDGSHNNNYYYIPHLYTKGLL